MKGFLRGATRAQIVAASTFVALVTSCGLVIDPDVLVAGNAAHPEGGVFPNDGGGGNTDGPAVDGCVGSSCAPPGEVCDDGKDNDKNGKTDCEDGACTASFACVDPAPEGWVPIAMNETARPNCPPGFGTPTDVVMITDEKPMTCKCTCGDPCAGDITLHQGTDSTCAGATQTFLANTNGVCTAKAFNEAAFAGLSGPTPVCAKTDTVLTKTNTTGGRLCFASLTAAGCQAGKQCVGKALGFKLCISKDGANTCPANFTKVTRTGTLANDQRICAGCDCTPPTSCDAELELWQNNQQCTAGSDAKFTTLLNGACAATPPLINIKGYKTKMTGSCTQLTPSTAQGQLTIANERTVCCK